MADEKQFQPRSWERWGYLVRESAPFEFVVENQTGSTIGWITQQGLRFQARGFAQSIDRSEILGTFESVKAAATLVIGQYDMLQLRDRVSRAVKKYEAEGPLAPTLPRPAPDRRRSTGAPGGTSTIRQPERRP